MKLPAEITKDSFRRVGKISRNLAYDLRLGGLYGWGRKPRLRNAVGRAYGVAATEYAVLDEIFDGRIQSDDVIVDVGCGRGRVVRWLLSNGVQQQIIGVELDRRSAAYAKRKLSRYPNVTIIEGDVLDNITERGSLYFLYNPFDGQVLLEFRKRLEEREGRGTSTVLLYYHCVHVDVFQDSPRWHTDIVTLRSATCHMPNQLAVISSR